MAESTEMDYKSLPKIELHAHLNGSLSTSCLTELYHMKYPNTDDPPSHINGYKILDKFVELKDCFEKFKYAHDLTDTPKRLKRATEIIINECHDDGVVYLEIRTTPRATEHMTKEVYLSTICEAIIECHEKEPKNPIVKLIPSFDRSKGVDDARDTLNVVLKMREKFPGMIVGIDLSGNPENTNFQDFKPLLQEAREAGLKLTLHCAERAGTEEENMEMLEFGMDRMGHGTFMDESPDTWLTLREKKIPVECCITSNLKCATVPDITKHHLQKLLHAEHPVVICTDDYGVFDTSLSKEIQLCAKTFNLSRETIQEISLNSVRFSFASATEKTRLEALIRDFFTQTG